MPRSPSRPSILAWALPVVLGAGAAAIGDRAGLRGWGLVAAVGGAVAAGAAPAALARRRAPPGIGAAPRVLAEAIGVEPPGPAPAEGEAERWAQSAAGRVGALRAELAIRRSVMDSTDAPVFATSETGVVIACNRASHEFLGRAEPEIVGREIGDFFSHAELLDLHARARSGRAQRGQVRMPAPGGARVFQVLATPAPGPGDPAGPPMIVLMLRDVTELAQAGQLKTDFVANASHELRTPLAAIRGAVETLETLGAGDEEMRVRLVRMIGVNAERLEDLTRDLLDLARLESPDAPVELGPVDLPELVQSVVALLEPLAGRRSIGVEIDIAPAAARLRSDRRLLTVILRNLAENALKFAYEQTVVRIVGEVIEGGHEHAPHGHARDADARGAAPHYQGHDEAGHRGAEVIGGEDDSPDDADAGGDQRPGNARAGLRLRIIDRGIGIPLSQQQRIFERFFQGDPARAGDAQSRGTGLGLAIVKHAVRALGGSIGVESVWKEGTTMTVEVPACVDQP